METKTFLFKNFNMKDLGEADIILNIKLIKGEDGITLTNPIMWRRSILVFDKWTVNQSPHLMIHLTSFVNIKIPL